MAKFGTVEWQDYMADKIMRKVCKGEPLDASEISFIEVQKERHRKMVWGG